MNTHDFVISVFVVSAIVVAAFVATEESHEEKIDRFFEAFSRMWGNW